MPGLRDPIRTGRHSALIPARTCPEITVNGHLAPAKVRTENRFEHLPPSTRHYAAHPEEALNAILKPLTD